MNRLLLIYLLIWMGGFASLKGQEHLPLQWDQLTDVKFAKPAPGKYGFAAGEATFGETIQELAGQEIEIKGYMLPITADNKEYILSRYSFDQCFFCGGAGKESVIMLYPDDQFEFELDEIVTFQGVLHLHRSPDSLAFSLQRATPVPTR
ncbi:MAG: DUF3299 domain-containing protein [Bacteroidota bacterium]